MVKSMTGYGRSEWVNEIGRLTVEIRSINHRYLELFMRAPKEFVAFEDEMKRCIQDRVKRGRVECTITFEFHKESKQLTEVNWGIVEGYMQAAEEIQKKYSLSNELGLDVILSLPDVLVPSGNESLESYKSEIVDSVSLATEALVSMRINEGRLLKEDSIDRINYIRTQTNAIRKLAPQVIIQYRDRLVSRVKEFLNGTSGIDEARIMNEVAIYADKSNIDEEIVRLDSHCKQYVQFLDESEPIGRKLDFLLQEMNREINTIGSKANDFSISQIVITIKSEIEKLREQVQNIE